MEIYSVNQLTNYIKMILEQDAALQNIHVRGEISNLRTIDNHVYFTLKDSFAVIDCVMFSRATYLLDFIPDNGMTVVVSGSIEIYQKRGNYQIVVEEMKKEGKGVLFQQFIILKDKLEKEGLFNPLNKKSIPTYPQKIGIISSLDGAALKDMLKVFNRKIPIEIFLYPSLVQGEKAVFSIIKGIRIFNDMNMDVIIIARGGGSLEDLSAFNDELLAREMFTSKIPIVTGIGHETDFTIADFVADVRAATPTAAAELVLIDKDVIINRVLQIHEKLNKHILNIINIYKKEIKFIEERNIFKKPYRKFHEFEQLLDERLIRLKNIIENKLNIFNKEYQYYKTILESLHIKSVLKRGYTLSMQNGKIITSVNDLKTNKIMATIFKDGKATSKIKNITPINGEKF